MQENKIMSADLSAIQRMEQQEKERLAAGVSYWVRWNSYSNQLARDIELYRSAFVGADGFPYGNREKECRKLRIPYNGPMLFH